MSNLKACALACTAALFLGAAAPAFAAEGQGSAPGSDMGGATSGGMAKSDMGGSMKSGMMKKKKHHTMMKKGSMMKTNGGM